MEYETGHSHFKQWHLYLPVCFTLILEVVHVTACLGVLGILGLFQFCLSQAQQLPVILHHKFSLFEAPDSKHSSSFSFYVFHLCKDAGLA